MLKAMFVRACSLVLILILLSASAFNGQRAEAQEGEGAVVVARAVGEAVPQGSVVRFIAANAEPRRFERAVSPEIADLTAEVLIQRLCGSVSSDYVQQFEVMNGQATPALTDVLGDRAYSLLWPACLYVEANNGQLDFTLRESDSAAEIRTGLTGAAPEREGLPQYFGWSAIFNDQLPAGTIVRPAFESAPTVLRVRPESSGDFAAQLQHVSRGGVQTGGDQQGGYIFPPMTTPSAAANCDGSADDYPFRPRAVRAAFQRTQTRLANADLNVRQTVYLYVVDNGFFGVPCVTGNCPYEDERGRAYSEIFPRRFFDSQAYPNDALGPTVQEIPPLNYGRTQQVDEVTAHGTHVAGLTLGGPLFLDAEYRNAVFGEPGSNWLRLVIASLGSGQRDFRQQADIAMFVALQPPLDQRLVVNLSLGVDEATRSRIGAEMRRKIVSAAYVNALFVAAAGNGPVNLNTLRLFPARLGGTGGANRSVITVGSIDANGVVSRFSNIGSYVDIAAPGCRISSWFTADAPPQPMSGTSQAAPLVSWTAAMLRSYWNVEPAGIKARIVYSGSLIADAGERGKIHYGVELDIPRALLVTDDLLSISDGSNVHTYVGELEPIQGLSCQDRSLPFGTIRSYKRNGAFRRLYYMDFDDDYVHICDARYDSPGLLPFDIFAPVVMQATHELVDGIVTPLERPRTLRVRVDDVVDIVFSNFDLNQ